MIPRAVTLLDYTPGGPSYNPAAAADVVAADEVHGEAGDDVIYAGGGNDVVYGGPGRDTILGKDGNDVIHARDGQRDTIDCGHQRDVAYVDRLDVVSHCEKVVRR